MDHLRVKADQAYNISRAVGNDAQELREESAGLQRDWDNLSREWSGVAASANSAIWGEWLEGATTLIDAACRVFARPRRGGGVLLRAGHGVSMSASSATTTSQNPWTTQYRWA
jgi:WXG100 family type VII secretion target